MSYSQFLNAIKTPRLKQVAEHWNVCKGARAMPDWSDLKPSRIAPQLPIIWAYRYDATRNTMIGRLAGDQIEKVFGKTFRNTPMSELYLPDQFAVMFARFRRVVCEPAFYVEEGKVFQHVERYGYGERIALPLSSDGVHGDGLIGATVYESFRTSAAQPAPDCELWFALDSAVPGGAS